MDFFDTRAGREFTEGTMKSIMDSLEALNENLSTLNKNMDKLTQKIDILEKEQIESEEERERE